MAESAAPTTNTPRRARFLRVRGDPVTGVGLGLTLLWTVPFFLIPVGLLLAYSFATQNYLTGKVSFGWTLSAWSTLGDQVVYDSLIRSIVLSSVATAACLLVGYPVAYFVAKRAGRFR